MRFLRLVLTAVLLAVVSLPAARAADEISRIEQLREQIKDRESLLEQATKNAEKAQYQKQLDRLRRELEIVEQRQRVDEKSRNRVRARPMTARSAVSEAVAGVEHSTKLLETETARVEGEIVKQELQRDALGKQRAALRETDEKALAQRSELDERINAIREAVEALRIEREALRTEQRLVEEANRVQIALKESPATVSVRLGDIWQTLSEPPAARRPPTELSAELTDWQTKRVPVEGDLEIGREKLAGLDDEIAFLDKQRGILNSNAQIMRQLRVAANQRKFLDQYVSAYEAQIHNLDRAILATSRTADLLAKEADWLEGVYSDRRARYARQMIVPGAIVIALAVVYFLLSQLVLPRMKHRENLVLMRRFARYLTLLAITAVVGGFLFDDLKMVITTLSIVGAGIVIALQDVATSIAGWVAIMTGSKFRIGDRIEADDARGDVIDIDLLRTTLLEVKQGLDADHPTGRVLTIPNSFVLKGKVFNASHGHPYVWSRQVFTFTTETPWRAAEAIVHRVILEETAADFAEARKAAAQMEKRYGVSDAEYTPKFYVRLADYGTEFACVHVCHFKKIDEARSRIHRRMAEELARDPRLVIAYPTQRQVTGFENLPPSPTTGPAVTAVASVPAGSAATVTVSDSASAR